MEEEKENNIEPEDEIEEGTEFYNTVTESGGDFRDAVFKYCFEHNTFYDPHLLKTILKDENETHKLPGSYLNKLAENEIYAGKTFFSQLKRKGFEKLNSNDLAELGLSDEDKRNRQQILGITSYDPFEDDAPDDKPQLYRDLVGMLTDNMRRDIPKQKAAIQVVHDYATINHYQTRRAQLEASEKITDEIQEQIDKCVQMISKMQDTINKLTKENGFSSGKGVGNNGRGGLSDVMNMCEERGYDKETVNMFDIETSAAIQQVANISMTALMNQVQLQGSDYADILVEQAKLVRKYRNVAAQALEAQRLAVEKLEKQKLLKEYEHELVSKGINIEDAKSIISQEINLYDGEED